MGFYQDVLKQLQDDFKTGNWRVKSYNQDGMQREFVSPDEFLKMMQTVERKASEESHPYAGRTVVRSATR